MIEKIKEKVRIHMNHDDCGHGFDHVERVYETAKKLLKEENANEFIITMIALMHDLYDHKFYDGDAKKALEPLKTSDPERYTQLVDRIDLESLSYRYLIVNNYDAYYTPTQVTDMQRNIKNDILRFNILKLKDGASGTSDLIYGGWNV